MTNVMPYSNVGAQLQTPAILGQLATSSDLNLAGTQLSTSDLLDSECGNSAESSAAQASICLKTELRHHFVSLTHCALV